jgi:hypothetical protein
VNFAKSTRQQPLRSLTRLMVAVFFAAQVIIAIPRFQDALFPLLTVPNISYTDKMYIQWRDIFVLLDFVRRETPENAVILMKEDGRPQFDLYFLFPRHLIYGNADAIANNPQVEYVLITDNYPQFSVDGVKKMMDDTHGLFELLR